MRRHHNTLYITQPDTWLGKCDEAVEVKRKDVPKVKVPLHHLYSIVCFGAVSVSPYLMATCAERNIAISFLSTTGRFLARVVGPQTGNVLLRRDQYRLADDAAFRLETAKAMLLGKLLNCRDNLRRRAYALNREKKSHPLDETIELLGRAKAQLDEAADQETLRGIEGSMAKKYFDQFTFLLDPSPFFSWRGRNTRPPRDPANAVLSFLYTILAHDCDSALQAAGLDPQVGFLHVDRSGRPALALDLMEEFRPLLVDRLFLKLVNLATLSKKHFQFQASGAVLLNEDGRKIVLAEYQKAKRKEIQHPILGETTTLGLLPHVQARILARTIRADIRPYPAITGIT